MAGKTHPIRLGVFVLLGTVLVIVSIFLIGNKESMFTKTFSVKAYFSSIEGLRNGAPVRLSGIDVGSVKDIRIVNDSLGQVEVTMRLSAEIMQFLRADGTATVETEGLVGNKVVNLTIGTAKGAPVRDGSIIKGITPEGFAAIIDETKGTLAYTKEMTRNLAEIVAKVNEGKGSIGKFVNNDELYYHTNSLVVTADKSLNSISNKLDSMSIVVNSLLGGVQSIVANVDTVIVQVDGVIKDVKSGKGLLGELIKDDSPTETGITKLLDNLISVTENTKSGTQKFSENMEALKRNWLFKSYFEERGYYDKTVYEKDLDKYLNQINERIRVLDERIETLRKLKSK